MAKNVGGWGRASFEQGGGEGGRGFGGRPPPLVFNYSKEALGWGGRWRRPK